MSNSWSNTSGCLILPEARSQEIKSGDGDWGGPQFLVLLEQDTGLTQVQRKICRFVLDKPRTEESKSNKSEVKRKDELMGQDTILELQKRLRASSSELRSPLALGYRDLS